MSSQILTARTNLDALQKILLIQPPQIHTFPYGVDSFSLGLAYIASSLRKEGLLVSFLDCFLGNRRRSICLGNELYRIGMSDQEIIARIKKVDPDFIGINIGFSRQYRSAVNIASLIRANFKNIAIIAGGSHVSADPESLNKSDFDYLVVGEGERSLPKLLYSIGKPSGAGSDVPGVYYRDRHRRFKASLPPEWITNLDELPFPAYDILPLNKVWEKRVPYANIIATRGCPHRCCFCSIHSVMGRKIRRRSIENVLSEIDLLVNKYGVREIYFEDDNLTSNMAWSKELFDRLAGLSCNIEIGVRNGIRADRVDKELLYLMQKAGCARVCFAPESGKQEVLDNIIGKRLMLQDVEDAVRLAYLVGLNVTCFFVVGLPGETIEDIHETIDFARKLRRIGCDTVDINCATPYPGTALYSKCIKEGLIKKDVDYARLHTWESIISTDEFTAEQVMSMRLNAMKDLSESFAERLRRGVKSFFSQPRIFTQRKLQRLNAINLQ